MEIFKLEEIYKLKPIKNIYTGVGSRKTPKDILFMFEQFSKIMELKGFKYRSGDAIGADKSFNINHNGEIYISPEYRQKSPNGILLPEDKFKKAKQIIIENNIHKEWQFMKSKVAWNLHARNVFQVIGPNFNEKSRFLICWTPDGAKKYEDVNPKITGGTGTAICLADLVGVPVYNINKNINKNDYEHIEKFINENENLIKEYDNKYLNLKTKNHLRKLK